MGFATEVGLLYNVIESLIYELICLSCSNSATLASRKHTCSLRVRSCLLPGEVSENWIIIVTAEPVEVSSHEKMLTANPKNVWSLPVCQDLLHSFGQWEAKGPVQGVLKRFP
ncbi:hypothetical protein Y1Q_0000469 [Alligator mississippiensis]|uniref:Uncharacterized protein n=1 Tax=Alligator mississippiensis TaxID=8496 RepID=A0A151MBH0_ALLMI|nr:hypothetical protein Y1Q_0000469 [Alligator mississippiensis]